MESGPLPPSQAVESPQPSSTMPHMGKPDEILVPGG
jgi:hypothetical protein